MTTDLEKNEGLEDAFFAVDNFDFNYAKTLNETLIKIETAYLVAYDSCTKNWTMLRSEGAQKHCFMN